jgi:hypothetical protein
VLLECCGARIRLQLLVGSVCLFGDWTEVCLLSSAESLLCEALSEFCCSCHVRIGLQLLVRPVSLTFEGLLVCWTGAHADSSYCVERQLYTRPTTEKKLQIGLNINNYKVYKIFDKTVLVLVCAIVNHMLAVQYNK